MGDASVGNVSDSYNNALTETINGLYRTEVIRCRGPWNGWTGLTIAAFWNQLEIRHQLNTSRCIIDNLKSRLWWLDSNIRVSGNPGAIQHNELILCKLSWSGR